MSRTYLGVTSFVEMSEQEAKQIEDQLEAVWVNVIAKNIEQLVARQPAVSILSNFAGIYGTTLGLAREKHLRAAWDRLALENMIQQRNKSERRLRNMSILRT